MTGVEVGEGYPKDFVDALTKAGYLGALIPEEYGGAALPAARRDALFERLAGLERLPSVDGLYT